VNDVSPFLIINHGPLQQVKMQMSVKSATATEKQASVSTMPILDMVDVSIVVIILRVPSVTNALKITSAMLMATALNVTATLTDQNPRSATQMASVPVEPVSKVTSATHVWITTTSLLVLVANPAIATLTAPSTILQAATPSTVNASAKAMCKVVDVTSVKMVSWVLFLMAKSNVQIQTMSLAALPVSATNILTSATPLMTLSKLK